MTDRQPPIGSDRFRELPWKDQLYLVWLRQHDQDEYYRVTKDPRSISRTKRLVDEACEFLSTEGAPPIPPNGNPIMLSSHWVLPRTYLGKYHMGLLEKYFGVERHMLLGSKLIKLPLFITKEEKWKGRITNFFKDFLQDRVDVIAWAKKLIASNGCRYKEIIENDLPIQFTYQVDTKEMIVLPHKREHSHVYYFPFFPSRMMTKENKDIAHWELVSWK